MLAVSFTAAAARLPDIHGDNNTWGEILNDYLNVSHNDTGQLRNNTVSTQQIADGSLLGSDLSPTTNITTTGTGLFGLLGSPISRIPFIYATNFSASGDVGVTGSLTLNSTPISDWSEVNHTYTHLSNFTNDMGFVNSTDGVKALGFNTTAELDNRFLLDSGESGLNVNSSVWWAGVSGWNAGWFEQDGDNLEFNETKLDGQGYLSDVDDVRALGFNTTSELDDWYLKLSGDNADQNISLGSYNISAAYFIGDGSKLDGISGDSIWTDSDGNATFTTGRVGIGTDTPSHELNVVGDANITKDLYANYTYAKNQVAQFHRVALATAAAADTWYNITWDMAVDAESMDSWYTLADTNQSVQISGFDGILRVQGCLHPYNDQASAQEAYIYVRVMVNGNEARCLQASTSKSFRSDGVDVLPYIGTVVVEDGDKINVEWQTSNTNIQLNGTAPFDNPVAASVNFEKISNKDD